MTTIDAAGPQTDEQRKRIGVIADREDASRQLLLAVLESAFPVRFEQAKTADAARDFDGVLAFDEIPAGALSGELPHLVLPSESRTASHDTQVTLAADGALPIPLRGRVIREELDAGPPPFAVPHDATVLASAGGRPAWWQIGEASNPLWLSAYPLSELAQDSALIEHLRSGRFMGLLPMLHFLNRVLGADGWTPPPLRASFVIDDPNLHWPSYGYLKYKELVSHAERHGYHVGLATVPLDGWLVNRRATSLLRDHPSELSLLMHGNDHVARELGRLSTDRSADEAIARALLRVGALERRTGLVVNRVMAPPHGACSEPALRAMFRLGMEAACVSRPYPWRDGLTPPTPLAGWHPAEMVAGGLPVLPRYFLGLPRDDLVFRALLGQPLILYGHHGDFAGGLDLLEQAARDVNGLGDVEWGPLSTIARGNYATRLIGDVLHVRIYSRHLTIDVPQGVRAVRVTVQEPLGGSAGHRLTHPAGAAEVTFKAGIGTATLQAVTARAQLTLSVDADLALDPAGAARRSVRPWPLFRRLAVEARDRIQPLLAGS
jgi:hypothetical protein